MTRIKGDLLDRTFALAVEVLNLVDELPHNSKGWAVAKQLCRCGTSVGANVTEADGALTDREFSHILNIARREALETRYWLRLSVATALLRNDSTKHLLTECDELIRILTTVVRKVRERLET